MRGLSQVEIYLQIVKKSGTEADVTEAGPAAQAWLKPAGSWVTHLQREEIWSQVVSWNTWSQKAAAFKRTREAKKQQQVPWDGRNATKHRVVFSFLWGIMNFLLLLFQTMTKNWGGAWNPDPNISHIFGITLVFTFGLHLTPTPVNYCPFKLSGSVNPATSLPPASCRCLHPSSDLIWSQTSIMFSDFEPLCSNKVSLEQTVFSRGPSRSLAHSDCASVSVQCRKKNAVTYQQRSKAGSGFKLAKHRGSNKYKWFQWFGFK